MFKQFKSDIEKVLKKNLTRKEMKKKALERYESEWGIYSTQLTEGKINYKQYEKKTGKLFAYMASLPLFQGRTKNS